MTTKSGIQAVTMIDLATGWIEIRTVPPAQADLVVNQIDVAWLTRYPLPSKAIVDSGNKLLAKTREMMINDYGIKVRPITSRNFQSNTIVERVHQTIDNILRTSKVQNLVLDDKKSMGQYISLHHVRPKGYCTHYYALHSCPTNIWTRFNNESPSHSRLENKQ